eukprot:augustus_masked-scaffold_17-processed-gene-5.45-mRNA-1 protein AED:0.09 eAED:0.09 QI:0/-1/0/1/-1/1/1/0/196
MNKIIRSLNVSRARSISKNILTHRVYPSSETSLIRNISHSSTNKLSFSQTMKFSTDSAEERKEPTEKVAKLVDEITLLNLVEVSQLVDELKSRLNLPDAVFQQPVAAVAAPIQAEAAEEEAKEEEKPIVNIQLDSFDAATKIKVIKEVKTASGLGLKEAKTLVEEAPKVVLENVKREEAIEIQKKLEEVGAKISLI